MTDYSPQCNQCKERMRCVKNGVEIQYGTDQVQKGDLWKCPECGCEIITGFGKPYQVVKKGEKVAHLGDWK